MSDNKLYSDARIIPAMKIWKLPREKEYLFHNICESGKYFLEEKVDGYWYEYEKTQNNEYLFSRNISRETGVLTEKGNRVPHIMKALSILPPETIVIGEIYVPGGTSKTVTHFLGCLAEEAIKRQEKEGLVHFYLHDIIFYDGINLIGTGAEDRYNILSAIWDKHDLSKYPFLRLATKVDTDLEAEISRILQNGGEGAVLKKKDYPYVPDMRPAWSTIKIKQMDSIDLICVGFCDAIKEYAGKEIETWNYWQRDNEISTKCKYGEEGWIPITKGHALGWKTAIEVGAYNEEGKLVKIGTVSSGLTDEDKQGMAGHPEDYLYKIVTLDCMSLDRENFTIRHPVLRCWREDKNAKDCIISEVFA